MAPAKDRFRDDVRLSERSRELLNEDFLDESHIATFEEALQSDELLIDTTEGPSPSPSFLRGTHDPPLHQTSSSSLRSAPNSPGGSSSQQDRSGFAFATGRTGPNSENNGYPNGSKSQGHSRRPSMAGSTRSMRVEKIKSLSDFAPVHSRVSRKRKSRASRSGWSYHLARWPLLGLIFFVIYLEFGMYIFTRQIVNSWEWLVAYTGRSERRRLRRRLRAARSYDEWVAVAKEMDSAFKFDEWKTYDDDPSYDYPLVRKVRRSLVHLRQQGDARGLMGVLEICLRSNFAGTEGARLYSETFFGTKNSVEAYVKEVKDALDYLRTNETISLEEKRRFFRSANKNFGASALCLSGGAGFGYYHFGVVKAFLEAGLLPRVVTGTSAGGLVAALTCTRTDEELRELLVPELADNITACEDSIFVWLRRAYKTGARFDTASWARKATFFCRGSTTFREAYERTGRALNISVIPHDQHSPTKLLNYLTAPDCVIWSAIIASAAVPGILNSVVLMQKMKDGTVKPMNWGSKYKDGSLRVDIPLQSLHLLFNVNFSIVSQVNPHIHLFFFAPQGAVGKPVAHRKGKGWRGGFLLSAAEQYLKLELTKNFKVIRDLELLPILLGQDWSGVFLQRFDGSVTIWPRTRMMDWIHILTDPNRKELALMLQEGQNVSWPKLHMIENRSKIEQAVLRGRSEVRQAMHRNRSGAREQYPTTTSGPSSARNTPALHTAALQHFPLESDAEMGFADRSSKGKDRARSPMERRGVALSEDPADSNVSADEPDENTAHAGEPIGLRKRRRADGSGFQQMRGPADHARQYQGFNDLLASSSDEPSGRDGPGGQEWGATVVDKQGFKVPFSPTRPAEDHNAWDYTRSRTRSFPTFPSLGKSFGFGRQEIGVAGQKGRDSPLVPSPLAQGQTKRPVAGPAGPSRFTRWLSPQLTNEPEDRRTAGRTEEKASSESSDSDEEDFLDDSDIERAGRRLQAEDQDGGSPSQSDIDEPGSEADGALYAGFRGGVGG